MPISLDLSLNYLEDTNDTQVIGQLRFSLPITRTFQLPVSLSYRSRTLIADDSEFRVNFGAAFDGDILRALSELTAVR